MTIETIITDLSNQRDKILEEREKLWNEIDFKDLYNDSKIDSIAEEILHKINEYRNELSIDFIIEQLTKLGQAPNILYDDDGRFAVISDGFQSVPNYEESEENMEFQFVVEKKYWKSTIREALYFYLDED